MVPSPITVTLVYTVAAVGTLSAGQLSTALQNVPLPTGDLVTFGLTLNSDSTSTTPPNAIRTLQFSTLPPVTVLSPVSAPGSVRGSIVSSSPSDVPGGTGAQQIRIDYVNAQGQANSEFAIPNGTTPVNLVTKDKVQITNVVVTQGSTPGLISVLSGLNGTGVLIGRIIENFQGSVISTSAVDTSTGIGAQTIQITYRDASGAGPFTENVTLNGQNWVNLVSLNHATILNMQLLSVGATGSSGGIITLKSGLNGTGATVAFIGPSFFQFFPQKTVKSPTINPITGDLDPSSTISAVSAPVAADIGAPLRNIYTDIIGAALASMVTATEPAFA